MRGIKNKKGGKWKRTAIFLVLLLIFCFLLNSVKNVYQKNRIVLDLLDAALRPIDAFTTEGQDPLLSSAVENLKNLNRYDEAWGLIVGSTQADALPRWIRDDIEGVDKAAGLFNMIYGNGKGGKEIVALMMARIIHCKALAAASQVMQFGVGGSITRIFGEDEKVRYFYPVLDTVYGAPEFDCGHGKIREWITRLDLVFKGNKFGADGLIYDAYCVLYTTDERVNNARSQSRFEKSMEGFITFSKALAEYSRFTK